MLPIQKGYVASAGRKGRGVFAKKKLNRGEVVEVAPYITVPPRDDRKLSGTIIESYWFEIKGKWSAIGLGMTSLYNHSEKANATFSINQKKKVITIKTVRPIRQNEEIQINY